MEAIYEVTIPGGGMWSRVLGRGKRLRMRACGGDANVGMLLYNADWLVERYNMPDTLKGQHIFALSHPYCVHSDMGRLLASITEDSCGWHDTACGCSDAELVREKYGVRTYQECRNDFYRNGRDGFLTELNKWGLGKRDLVPNLNWFSKVLPDAEGNLSFVAGHSREGDAVTLRMEMRTLVVLNTCQHPLDPNPDYAPRAVELAVFEGEAPGEGDPCIASRPENGRAYQNTKDYHRLQE